MLYVKQNISLNWCKHWMSPPRIDKLPSKLRFFRRSSTSMKYVADYSFFCVRCSHQIDKSNDKWCYLANSIVCKRRYFYKYCRWIVLGVFIPVHPFKSRCIAQPDDVFWANVQQLPTKPCRELRGIFQLSLIRCCFLTDRHSLLSHG